MPVMRDFNDCFLSGSAISSAFLHDGLGRMLDLQPPLPNLTWLMLRRSIGMLHGDGGLQRAHQQMMVKLAQSLGYSRLKRQDPVITREGAEDGGWLTQAGSGVALRAWSVAADLDREVTGTSARAGRTSPTRIAQRVLLACGEPAGLLLNGEMIRLLLSNPSRADSHLSIALTGWRDQTMPPDSFQLLRALAGAGGLPELPQVLAAARLHQTKVTTHLQRQARDAITGFINAVLDRQPDRLNSRSGPWAAAALWQESLVVVYRLLFILKMEAPAQAGGGFSFASTRLWRTALSPNQALGPIVRRHLDHAADTGRMLESGLRLLFSAFRDGLCCSELHITPLGGALFGAATTPLLESLDWGERAVAILLDRLIWITVPGGERARVHYGALDVEDLGSIYEALLEQEPGFATEAVTGLQLVKSDGDLHRSSTATTDAVGAGRFFLRTGMGRKASGSFYTPHEFVSFLVRETLAPMLVALSPPDDPQPAALLTLKIVDPASGSGHFLVAACRYLGEALLTACQQCDARGLHQRIAALPDPDNTLAAYLPSRAADGGGGFSEARARAICRRLVAVHCLYGCDRNKLAVELAKLSLWLESYAEGLPLTFLDHRLIHGDALSGPFFASLSTLPVTGGPLDPLLAQGVSIRLRADLDRSRRLVLALNASIGRDLFDLAAKHGAKVELDDVLHPLRQLARAWSGAAMLRQRDSDDVWLGLAHHVATTGAWPDTLTPAQAALQAAGTEAVAWDLQFPEIFPGGFTVVLGNPPWDVVQHNTKDFVADLDPSVLVAKTRAQRAAIEQAVLARPGAAAAFVAYRTGFEQRKRIADRLYQHQRVSIGSAATAGNLDLFRLFAERALQLVAADGAIGVLMPSAFHANEGATGIRRLYFNETDMVWCLSFENRRRIFAIDSRFKFDLIVARRPGPTRSLRCGFYLEGIDQVADPARIMRYPMALLEASSGASLTPLELRGQADLAIAKQLFDQGTQLDTWCQARGIRLGRDLHMTDDAGGFRPLDPLHKVISGHLLLHEGKTFHQYTDQWDTRPRYCVAAEVLRPKPAVAEAARHYRVAFRDIARSNDERTMIACVAPPAVVFGHTATVEKSPGSRTNADALIICALFNACAFDWLVRQKAAVHLSLYLLAALPMPSLTDAARRFLAHGTLRLSCARPGYGALWRDQVGKSPNVPVLHEAAERWALRSQMDAVVADAYGLTSAQYTHVLNSFSHKSYPAAAALCTAAFKHLQAVGIEAFCTQYDPFAALPLVTTLARSAFPPVPLRLAGERRGSTAA